MTPVARWLAAAPPTLILVAHPDDETIGAGGQMGRLGRLTLVHLTDGAPRDPWFWQQAGLSTRTAYARLRAAELSRALAAGGIEAHRFTCGAPDQEAVLSLPALTQRTLTLLRRIRPAFVLTHPYEGGHPDHDAAAFIVSQAVAAAPLPRPVRLEMAFYHQRSESLVTGRFLPGGPPAIRVPLSPRARARKQVMLEAFASQQAVLARFGLDDEAFRLAPDYDFTSPPHPGVLHYERFGWPLDGARVCGLFATALNRAGADDARRSG